MTIEACWGSCKSQPGGSCHLLQALGTQEGGSSTDSTPPTFTPPSSQEPHQPQIRTHRSPVECAEEASLVKPGVSGKGKGWQDLQGNLTFEKYCFQASWNLWKQTKCICFLFPFTINKLSSSFNLYPCFPYCIQGVFNKYMENSYFVKYMGF